MVRILLSFLKHYFLNIFDRKSYLNLTENENIFIGLLKKEFRFKSINKNKILVEGDLIKAGPNYFFRLLSLANLYSNKYNFSVDFVFNGYKNYYAKELEFCKKIGLGNFIFARNRSSLKLLFISYFSSIMIYYRYVYQNLNLKYLKYKDIEIGDFIIDSYLKAHGIDYSSRYKDIKVFKFIFESIYLVNFYNKILNPSIYKIILVTHTQYINYGILARMAYKRNIQVIETTDMALLSSSPFDKDKIQYPSYHSSLRKMIKTKIINISNKEEFIQKSKINLENRLNGNSKQYDLVAAYSNKKIYSDKELREVLNINNKNPFVFILAHVFSDAPLSIGENMLFSDYYDWLNFTIKQASLNKNINWVVKPHPSSYVYNEDGIVKKIISNLEVNNIFLSPDDFNTSSIKNLAKAIVTARGTAGIEYSCLGIPVILSGDTFYSSFGFAIEPDNKIEYKQILNKLSDINYLSQEDINNALIVYGCFIEFSGLENDLIITTELLNNVWGMSGSKIDIDNAYSIINSNIQKFGAISWTHLILANNIDIE